MGRRPCLFSVACSRGARAELDAGHAAAPAQERTDSGPTAAHVPAPPPAVDGGPSSASSSTGRAVEELRGADGGAAACKVLRGPVALPVRGAVALVPRSDAIDAILDQDGQPRVVSLPAPPFRIGQAPAGTREPAAEPPSPGLTIPCAVAADRVFCADRAGNVHRTSLATGGDDRVVASSRAGSRIAAGVLGADHVALAYLASRQTSEGWVSEAWLAVDDRPPVRLSEDGCGATAVTLARRGDGLVALSVDARAALTALHARPLSFDGAPRLGEDAVVFVGGPGDRRTAAALAPTTGPSWALMPIAKDVGSFGLAIVQVEDPPRVDEPVTWSMYPNGLDPAPVAAAGVRGGAWVARVRPQSSEPGSPRALEVGRVRDHGAFDPLDLVPTVGAISDVALAADARGALWIGWLDGTGAWVARLVCP